MGSLLAPLFEGDDDSFYARLAACGGEVISDGDFAACYSADRGRPSIPPSLLMRAVLCQIRDDVSDREAARRAAKDLDWKRALGLQADEVPFHHTTLSVFRSRLLVNDADGVVLRRTIERAVGAGLFGRRVLAIADSTGVMGAAAVADTYELIRQGICRLVAAAGGPGALPARLRKRARAYAGGKAHIDWSDTTARRDELGSLVATARELLAVTGGRGEAAEARGLLGRIVDQDTEENPEHGGGPAIRQGVAPDRVISTVDPDMRHGRKTSSQRIDGFKAHLLTDHDTELVLGVSVTGANCPDGPQAAPLIAAARQVGVPVTEMLGDTAYGDGDTRIAVEKAGAKVTAKTQPPAPTGKFTKTAFTIDPDKPSATCPAGHTTTRHRWSQDHKGRRVRVMTFSAELCGPCPLRERCTINPDGRHIVLNFHEARLQAARTEQNRPSTRRKLRRRAVIERKIAEAKRHGMGKARYRSARKVLLQERLTAGLLNLKRLFTLLDTQPAPQPG
ncbi:MAG: IS1182 family transposase [Actinomycetota bacterium]